MKRIAHTLRTAFVIAAVSTSALAETMINGQQQVAIATLPAQPPFQRVGDPFILPATTTVQNYLITQPDDTQSYRGFNPCMNADVRVKTVKPIAPVTTQPVTFNGQTVPNVMRITSAVDAPVTQFTGTLFPARSPEVLGSTQNLVTGNARAISIMIVPIPGWPGATPDLSGMSCPYNIGYGNGSGG